MTANSSEENPNESLGEGDLTAAQNGSLEAIGRLMEQCRPLLLWMANHKLDSDLRTKGGGSDLVQQTFLDAQNDFANFQGKTVSELISWLQSILEHNLIDFARKFRETQQRDLGREQPLDVAAPTVQDALAEDDKPPPDQVVRKEERQQVERALDRLPEDYRQVIQLRHREDRTFEEIGTLMDRSAEAARKLWLRAVNRLRLELGE